MKELSIEEKAKAYDEAIAKGKQIQNTPYTAHWDTMKEVVEHLFPELKETEDKIIIDRIKKAVINYWSDEALDEILAWLEKQGEQKSAEWSEEDERIIRDIITTLSVGVSYKESALHPGAHTTLKEAITWLQSLKDRVFPQPKQEWSEEDEAIYYGVIETEQYMLDVVNGIKKFDVGNASIKEDCTRELNWLKNIKDRVQPQPKQEWNEEDKNMLQSILDEYKSMPIEKRNWLKSLCPQSHWKPSEEMLEALYRVIPKKVFKTSKEEILLDELYQGLKYGKVLSEK